MLTRRADPWAAARTLADLGELTAQWLEGAIPAQPGYLGRPADETAPLAGVLARVCRAGYVTYSSQPGFDGPGFDGARWQQRAAVEGLVADAETARRLVSEARIAGLFAAYQSSTRWWCRPRAALTVSRRRLGGRWVPTTGFGVRLSRRELATIYDGVHPRALRDVWGAWQVTLVDPEWGPGGRLWALLGEVLP